MAIHYKLRQGVTLQEQNGDQLLVDTDGRVVRCQHPDEALKRMLGKLESSGGSAKDLFAAAAQGGDTRGRRWSGGARREARGLGCGKAHLQQQLRWGRAWRVE